MNDDENDTFPTKAIADVTAEIVGTCLLGCVDKTPTISVEAVRPKRVIAVFVLEKDD